FVWGAAQPFFGALADRYGAGRVIVLGAILLSAGMAAIPFVHTEAGLIMSLGIVSAIGAGAASFSILIGSMMQRLPPERRSFAAGFVNAARPLRPFLLAPVSP